MTVCVVEDPEAVVDEARRQADAPARGGGRPPRRASAGAAGGRLRAAARTRRRRRSRRGGGSSCAPWRWRAFNPAPDAPPRVRVESAPHTTLRAELQQARAAGAAQRESHELDIGTPLRDRMRRWLDAGFRVRVVAPNRTHADRLVALLRALGLATDLAPPRAGDELFARGPARRWPC